MKKYDFDIPVERRGSGCLKHDGLLQFYSRQDLTPMWVADMDLPVADEITEALRLRTLHPVYGYPVVPDSFWRYLLAWQRKRHGFTLLRNQVIFIPGIVKGIGILINFFTSKGDGIVIQPPVYHPFKRLIDGNGRKCIENPLIPVDGGYEMDLKGLEKIFKDEHPKMMILCNPHNPIGIQWEESTLREVAALAARYDVIVVSDEIHGDLMLQGRAHTPYLACGEDAVKTGIMLAAPSKTFNIPGMVSSWCAIKNPDLSRPFFEWMEVNEFCAPTEMAMIATEAAYRNGESWLDQALAYIESNVDFTVDFLAENAPELKVIKPQASFMVWIDFRALGLSEDKLHQLLENDAHIAVNYGSAFGKEGEGFARVNVAAPRAVIEDALRRLVSAINNL